MFTIYNSGLQHQSESDFDFDSKANTLTNANVLTSSTMLSMPICCVYNYADVHGSPKPKCAFPAWFSQTSWVDVVGLNSYQIASTSEIIVSERRHWSADDHVGQTDGVLYGMTCLMIESNKTRSINDVISTASNTSNHDVNDVVIIVHVVREWYAVSVCK